MKDLNKWAADQCHARKHRKEYITGFLFMGNFYKYKFDINRASCREMFRNWWLFQDKRRCVTITSNECWYFVPAAHAVLDKCNAKGIDELHCITEIYKSSLQERESE